METINLWNNSFLSEDCINLCGLTCAFASSYQIIIASSLAHSWFKQCKSAVFGGKMPRRKSTGTIIIKHKRRHTHTTCNFWIPSLKLWEISVQIKQLSRALEFNGFNLVIPIMLNKKPLLIFQQIPFQQHQTIKTWFCVSLLLYDRFIYKIRYKWMHRCASSRFALHFYAFHPTEWPDFIRLEWEKLQFNHPFDF